MSSDAEIRWKQFLENYEKALKELNKFKDTVFESNLEKAGYILISKSHWSLPIR